MRDPDAECTRHQRRSQRWLLVNEQEFLGRSACLQKQSGFTLIEAMVVVAILGIFTALAAPSFSNTIATMRIKSTSFDLVNDLNTARSEAIKRNEVVVVAAEDDDWNKGWSITIGGTTLKTHDALIGTITIASGVTEINFQSNGRPAAATELSVTSSLTGVTGRCVELQATGSARSVKEAC